MHKVKVAEYRRAAESLRANGRDVTVSSLAEKLEKPTHVIEDVFHSMSWLRKELGVVKAPRMSSAELMASYAKAARKLAAAGEDITCKTLAKATGKDERVLRAYFLERHPDRAAEIGLLKEYQLVGERWHRGLCFALAQLLEDEREITVRRIAILTRREKATCFRKLKKVPALKRIYTDAKEGKLTPEELRAMATQRFQNGEVSVTEHGSKEVLEASVSQE